jgi:hypothetical protein
MKYQSPFRIRLALPFTRAAIFAMSAALATSALVSQAHAENDVPRAYRMGQAEFHAIRGTYALENGMTLRVYRQQNRLFAEFDNARRLEIVAVSPTTFVAPANGQYFSFQQHSNGIISTVTLSANQPITTAQGAPSQCISGAAACEAKKP